ncbi:MAG: glutamyl-tRNA reductase [Eubacterium sp.]|nr:glutamyl-tRNA reductase [Eubacterium sp.]MDD7208487.1 glutamyl-tRNA reductase [Lachnospiraceae bacterium]MDY5497610.1 glutamyl-tRNA reductase [Anaerobutyricum sp.]
MGIQIISISHKIAPLPIREMFAFTKEQQESMMRDMTAYPGILECVVLSTCNRTEMCVYAESEKEGEVFGRMEEVLLKEAGVREEDDVGKYLLFYAGQKAVHHLFGVAAGLDSMVIGEDQILGQVKSAHNQAREAGTTGVYLNTLFRMAVTGAKKVKTKTELSKTSVSTATLALKVAEKELGTLKGKKVLIIGASGRIGGIVLMNLQALHQAEIFVTTRRNKVISTKHGNNDFSMIEYEERYDYLDEMDVVISATKSPHYTFTYNNMKKRLVTQKPRVFVDLAVPMDIEGKIGNLPDTFYYNIDDFTRIAKENNQKKIKEAENASEILGEYELQFLQWMVFQKSLPVMARVRENFLEVAEKKGVEKAFDHLFYWVRENNTPQALENFFECLDH